MARGLFVTGTDTGVGKTLVAAALLHALAASGKRVVGMKPVSAGLAADGSANPDVAALQAAGNVQAPLPDRNPFAFLPAIAPHLAAADSGATIDLEVIAAAYARLAAHSDLVVVEGAGGALVPLDATHDMLVGAGFADPVMDMEQLTLTYADAGSLMRELKQVGASNATRGRPRGLMGRGRWQRAVAALEAMRREGTIPATYEVVYGHAWKGEPKFSADGHPIVQLKRTDR